MSRADESRVRQEGVALLLVLGTLAITMVALTTLVRVATTAKLGRSVEDRSDLCARVLRQAEAPVLAWLERESTRVVLPPDCTDAQVPLLCDTLFLEGVECRLQITAWDECAMAPLPLVQGGSALRLALSSNVRDLFDRRRPNATAFLGLDSFCREGEESPFPTPRHQTAVRFCSAGESNVEIADALGDLGAAIDQREVAPPALGAQIATHFSGTGAINVNTAPIDLLEATLRSLGRRGVLDAILAARASGVPATLGGAAAPESKVGPALVAVSDAWAVRIDMRAGSVERSWWAVYRWQFSRWRCVQRLAIFH